MKIKKNYKTFNIIILGVGNIGMRHVQSLVELQLKVNFFLVDPIFKKRNRIKNFLENQIGSSKNKFFFYEDIDNIDCDVSTFDLCIISTNSDKRFFLFKKITSLKNIKYIILEKFLFNKLSQYKKIMTLNKKNLSISFVNQWLCQSKKLRTILNKFKNCELDINIKGTEWGMACNILHFIDLARYFQVSDTEYPKIVKSKFKKIVRPAKRSGFFELYGDILLKYGKHNLSISCDVGNFAVGSSPYGIDIEIKSRNSQKKFLKFKLKSAKIYGYENIDGTVKYFSKKIELISQLTGDVFKRIKSKKKVYLPTLAQSIKQHKVVFKIFADHFNKILKTNKDICPIT